MVTGKLKELENARVQLAQLEEAARAELTAELKTLPEKYGYGSVEAFISAVRLAGGSPKRRGRPPKVAFGLAATARSGRKKRAKITKETHAQLRKLVKEGKTGAQIARELDISVPSVQNIKKALGLVQER